MTKRWMTGLAVAALLLGACGSDAPKAMDEDDFVDAMTELCDDAKAGAERADLPEGLDDFDGIVDYADEGLDVLGEQLDAMRELIAPEDLAKDFEQYVQLVEDKLEQVEALKAAAEDEDEDAIADANDEMGSLLEDQADIADDLGIDACAGSRGNDATDPSEPTDPTGTTLPTTETTLPVTETTLPTVTVPDVTVPDVTLPGTVAPSNPESSDGEPSGDGIRIAPLAGLYVAPAGYTLVDTPAEDIQPFVDVIESFPDLAASISEVGVAVFNDAAGTSVATVVIAITGSGDPMPESWITVLCDPATRSAATTPAGTAGYSCPGSAESGIVEVFTQTRVAYGYSIATFSGSVSALTLTDDFAAAN